MHVTGLVLRDHRRDTCRLGEHHRADRGARVHGGTGPPRARRRRRRGQLPHGAQPTAARPALLLQRAQRSACPYDGSDLG